MLVSFDNQPVGYWRWECDPATAHYCRVALARGRRHMTHKWVATCQADGGRVKVEVTDADLKRMAELDVEKAA